jgi:Zn/Cd-binding protein ZinT
MNLFSPEIISLLIGLVTGGISLIWRVAKAEKDITVRIDSTRDLLEKEITSINHKIELLTVDNNNDHEQFHYVDNGLKELITHKSKRLERWLYEISSHLEKETKFTLKRGLDRQKYEQ